LATIKTAVITGYGINADFELAEAFARVGASPERIHISRLFAEPKRLEDFRILAFPGGFSFGDHLGSGLVFANLFKKHMEEPLRRFIERGNQIIGICNGFQVLVKMGVLPNLTGDWTQEVTLVHNDSGVFVDSWVTVRGERESRCVWTRGIDRMDLPIRHGEGRFISADASIRAELREKRLIALRYDSVNPNGSEDAVAGITDSTGRILGLMPHPEAFLEPYNHPVWKRGGIDRAEGLEILRNGVEAAGKI
jgi:phosphoribosylformylglycinamidine synthase subunit PurQ / glutaminase